MFFKPRTLLVCLLAIVSFSSFATTWYVNDNSTSGDVFTSATGADLPGRGSSSAPFASVVYMINMGILQANDVVFIDAGNYNWNGINLTGTLESIDLLGAGQGVTNISMVNGNCILIDGTKSHKIQNISFTNFNNTAFLVRNGGAAALVDNCDINCNTGAAGRFAVEVDGAGFGFQFSNCNITSGVQTIRVNNSFYIEFVNCNISGGNANNGMIIFSGSPGNNQSLRDCYITGVGGSNSIILNVFGGTATSIFRNQFQCNGAEAAMRFNGSVGTPNINNNFIWNVRNGIQTWTSSQNILFLHNSVNATENCIIGNTAGMYIAHNILKTHSNNSSYACINSVNAPTAGAPSLNSNVYYNPGAAKLAYLNSTAYNDINALRAGTIFGTYSYEQDPLFYNGSAGSSADLRVFSSSIAIDNAFFTYSTLGPDVFGNFTFNTYGDIGAFEYQGVGPKMDVSAANDIVESAPSFVVNGDQLIVTDAGADVEVEFYNLSGKVVRTVSGQSTVNLAGMNAGMYVAKVASKGHVQTGRVVVQ